MAEKHQYSSCLVDRLMVGIRVEAVQEVTAGSELTPVPLASPLVSGLLNLRGEIVTAIDLRRSLQLGDRPADQPTVNLILRTDDDCVSLLVDQVGEVFEVNDDDIEQPPNTLRGRLRELITGACKLDGGLLLLLNTEAALSFSVGEQS